MHINLKNIPAEVEISSWSDLKRRSRRLFLKRSPLQGEEEEEEEEEQQQQQQDE